MPRKKAAEPLPHLARTLLKGPNDAARWTFHEYGIPEYGINDAVITRTLTEKEMTTLTQQGLLKKDEEYGHELDPRVAQAIRKFAGLDEDVKIEIQQTTDREKNLPFALFVSGISEEIVENLVADYRLHITDADEPAATRMGSDEHIRH